MAPGMEEIHDAAAGTTWRFDRDFLASRWTCLWGRGCLGIGTEPAPELGLGCCSVGAELGDVDEARLIAALAATLGPELFEHRADATEGGIFSDATRTNTRVVDGACIFLNRPGFDGGAGSRSTWRPSRRENRRSNGNPRCAGSCPSKWTGRKAKAGPKWLPCGAGRAKTGAGG